MRSLYGYSGASQASADAIANEKLLAHAILRQKQFGDMPYYIGSDFNVDPQYSPVIIASIEAEITFDIVNDAYQGNAPPTYCKGGITAGMSGAGVTSIDAILASRAGSHLTYRIHYHYSANLQFDHVPIRVTLCMA